MFDTRSLSLLLGLTCLIIHHWCLITRIVDLLIINHWCLITRIVDPWWLFIIDVWSGADGVVGAQLLLSMRQCCSHSGVGRTAQQGFHHLWGRPPGGWDLGAKRNILKKNFFLFFRIAEHQQRSRNPIISFDYFWWLFFCLKFDLWSAHRFRNNIIIINGTAE